jgi:predicted GIY-YIG superfamily endonuclease
MMSDVCRVCNQSTSKDGYLYRCKSTNCGAAHWDKRAVLKNDLDDPTILQEVLDEAKVPPFLKAKKSHYVYVLRLRGELNSVYVGMTGLHPLARYLNHIRGYKSSSAARTRVTAILKFEGPMESKKAANREVSLADELRSAGMNVYGGH